MSENINKLYQRDGYKTDKLSVSTIMRWATNNFGGDIHKALEFCLTGIEDPRDINALTEACHWLTDKRSGSDSDVS